VAELLALGADPERVHVVPCGVDLDRFSPDGPRSAPWTPGAWRLLSIGRLVPRKGVETAIEALADLPEAELVVAGGDPPAAGGSLDARRLVAAARAAGVDDRVHLVGRVEPAGGAALMRAADLVVAVPWYEPFGIVPLEAMACGTPVVASAVGGMLDTVRPGATGWHVPPRDPAAVAAAVRDAMSDPARLAAMGRAGAREVAARYAWPAIGAETEAVYQRLAPSGTRSTTPSSIDLRRMAHVARTREAL
jgi:glycosyltransferase involved in cell wall biosynthesis